MPLGRTTFSVSHFGVYLSEQNMSSDLSWGGKVWSPASPKTVGKAARWMLHCQGLCSHMKATLFSHPPTAWASFPWLLGECIHLVWVREILYLFYTRTFVKSTTACFSGTMCVCRNCIKKVCTQLALLSLELLKLNRKIAEYEKQ